MKSTLELKVYFVYLLFVASVLTVETSKMSENNRIAHLKWLSDCKRRKKNQSQLKNEMVRFINSIFSPKWPKV